MPKIRKIKVGDRKDSRGGGYSRRKFTVEEADAIRKEYIAAAGKITISSLAAMYSFLIASASSTVNFLLE